MARDSVKNLSQQVINLLAAIEFTFVVRDRGGDALTWLDEWRHGDTSAMIELETWQKEQRGTPHV